jgi:hypothetical protein
MIKASNRDRYEGDGDDDGDDVTALNREHVRGITNKITGAASPPLNVATEAKTNLDGHSGIEMQSSAIQLLFATQTLD